MRRFLIFAAVILIACTGAWAVQDGAKVTGKADGKAPKVEDVTKPVVLTQVQPKYPEEARKKGIQGVIKVEATVGKEGNVIEAVAVDPLDPELAQSAVEAVKQWKFKPATDKKGKPVQVKMTVSINFKLQ